MLNLLVQVEQFIKRVPKRLSELGRSSGSEQDPLFRTLDRENQRYAALLDIIRSDLAQMKEVLDGSSKGNNHVRALFKDLQKDTLPSSWKKYEVEPMTVALWVEDFSARVEAHATVAGSNKVGRSKIWLGSLINPEAFFAATRQFVAKAHDWSLEELVLSFSAEGDPDFKDSPDGFLISELTLYGAAWKKSALALTNDVSYSFKTCMFTWKKRDAAITAALAQTVSVPVYLNSLRNKYLFSINLKCPADVAPHVWLQRGVCLTVWHPQV